MNSFSLARNFLLDLLYPKFCLGCETVGSYFCQACITQTPLQLIQRCLVCQKPALEGFTHPKCQSNSKPERLYSLYDYGTKPISELIITGKYQFIPEIFERFGKLYADSLMASPITVEGFTLATIPLSPKRLRWRGFNQADLIAKAIAHSCRLPLLPLLQRTRHTKAQKDLDKLQRLRNVKNAFRICTDSIPEKVILIDDVVTTGTTLLEAATVLKRAGVQQVWCLAIAQD